MTEIGKTSAAAYDHGVHPIAWATWLTEQYLETWLEVAADRDTDPAAHSEYGDDTTEAVACRIVGGLLEAGWIPPSRPAITGEESAK